MNKASTVLEFRKQEIHYYGSWLINSHNIRTGVAHQYVLLRPGWRLIVNPKSRMEFIETMLLTGAYLRCQLASS